jgi:hypothetical protein
VTGGHHKIVCQYGFVHGQCRCPGPHTTTDILCNIPAHQKEHSVTTETTETVEELEARLAELKAVTPEDVAATALDEADGGYDIQPAHDPEDHVHEDEDDEQLPNVLTAFLVIVQPDGAAFATSELSKIGEVVPAREATIIDMRRACQEVVHDVNAMQTAQQTVGLMQQSAAQMAEEKRNQQIAQKLVSRGVKLPRK